jgi:GT2 family glycosyltransferase
VGSIQRAHPQLDTRKVIVVDDGVSDRNHFPVMTWIQGIKPFIYARNVNLGIKATEDDIVIMGDDVLVKTPRAFDLLSEHDAAIVSPSIDGPVGNIEQSNLGNETVRESTIELAFICVYITREWWDRIGPLDEDFRYYGGEDVDWCWRALDAGGRLLIDGRVVVQHNAPGMPSAYRSQRGLKKLNDAAIDLLDKKWPGRRS